MTDHQLAQVVWDYMRYETPLEKADIILGLGSDDIRIAENAAALYLQGYAPKILFSGGNIQVGINLSMEEYVKDARYNFERTVKIMLGDLQRIREYPKLGYQTEQDIPDEVWKSYQKLTRRGYDKNLIKKGV